MPPSLPGPERDSCCKTPSLALALEHPGEAAGAPGNLLLRGSRPLTRGCYYFIVLYCIFIFHTALAASAPLLFESDLFIPGRRGFCSRAQQKARAEAEAARGGCGAQLAAGAAGATAAANLQLPRARARGISIIFSGRHFQRKEVIDVVLPLSNN